MITRCSLYATLRSSLLFPLFTTLFFAYLPYLCLSPLFLFVRQQLYLSLTKPRVRRCFACDTSRCPSVLVHATKLGFTPCTYGACTVFVPCSRMMRGKLASHLRSNV
ncbi:hypothetical protein BDV29DRAFT_46285 [Aspergillus leporis]|uniref:Uncharacterized protein n=1 Tax=Aspergillus leporis TaxID=41062 RepID=A0A5N5WR61_9EURO|nr:hypothetical protein BDV29DRAFT_46285 [Aspergillus leporis]